jgi:sulfate permease, SulP family
MRQLDQLHGLTVAIGMGSVLLLSLAKLRLAGALRRWGIAAALADVIARLAPMAVVLLGAGVVFAAGWEHELQVVGKLPAGLPAPFVLAFDPSLWGQLLVPALLIALIGFMESASIARAWATSRWPV